MEEWRKVTEGVSVVQISEKGEKKVDVQKALFSKEIDERNRKTMMNIFNNKDSDPDLTIKCHKTKFACHSIVLKKHKYFRNIKEKEVDLTKLVKYPEHLEAILKYIYKGTLDSPKEGHEIGMYQLACTLGLEDCASMLRAWMGTFLKVQDACKILEQTLENGHYRLYEVLIKIIERQSKAIFKTDYYLSWSKKNFFHFIEHANVELPEIEIFDIVVNWCKEQAKKEKKPLKEIFKGVEKFIRYPLMDVEEFATVVEPMFLLSEELVFETYKYFALDEEDRETLFKNNPRTKSRGTSRFTFKFKNNGDSYIRITDDGTCLGLSTSTTRTVIADKVITKKGFYFWEIDFQKGPSTPYSMIGICNPSNPQRNGYCGNNPQGYAVYLCNGTKYNRSSSKTYHRKITAPCKIGVILDCTKTPHKLYFTHNGKSLGEAFSDIKLPTVPCITITNSQSKFKLVKNPKLPKNWKTKSY